MATIAEIYQVEDALETCCAAILTAASVTAHRQRGTSEMASPACSVQVSNVITLGKQKKIGSNTFNYPADFGATLTVRVVTERTKNASTHKTYVGKVRAGVFDLSAWTSERLPLHTVHFIEGTGSTEETDGQENYDVTSLTFGLRVAVKDTAWP